MNGRQGENDHGCNISKRIKLNISLNKELVHTHPLEMELSLSEFQDWHDDVILYIFYINTNTA